MKILFEKYANNLNRDSVSSRLREKRFNSFIEKLSVTKNDKILDVGGTEAAWIGSGYERNVTLVNINFTNKMDDFRYVEGDACNMDMFSDSEFDVLYSNSVIEHVGLNNQKDFAREVKRVGRKYWVQTPYKHFPIEPHLVFPLFQYFPSSIQKIIALRWPYSHYKMGNTSDEVILTEMSMTHLLNKKEMQFLFDDGIIIKEKYSGLIKSLIACRV